MNPVPFAAEPSRRRCMQWALGTAAAAGMPVVRANVRPASARVGINAGVSFKETEDQQRQRYAGLLDALGRASGQRLAFSAVYSDRVSEALAASEHDFLIIHTHMALHAEQRAGWRVLAFSDDRQDDAVQFFVRPDSPLRSLAQVARQEVGMPGRQSWATACALAALRTEAGVADPRVRITRLQEVVPYMVSLRAVDVGACRSSAVVAQAVAAGQVRVVHRTPSRPLYALIAAPDIAGAQAERLQAQVQALEADTYEGLPFRRLHAAASQASELRRFFLG